MIKKFIVRSKTKACLLQSYLDVHQAASRVNLASTRRHLHRVWKKMALPLSSPLTLSEYRKLQDRLDDVDMIDVDSVYYRNSDTDVQAKISYDIFTVFHYWEYFDLVIPYEGIE